MSNIARIKESFETEFSDNRILESVRNLLDREITNGQIIVEDIRIPVEEKPELHIVKKALILDKDDDVEFAPLRAQIVVGSYTQDGSHDNSIKRFFVTLYYDLNFSLVTCDFHFKKR